MLKNKNKLKYVIVAFVCLIGMITSSNVYGYNIEYQGKMTEKGTFTVDMVVKSNIEYDEKGINYPSGQYNRWLTVQNLPGCGTSSYGTQSIGFSKSALSEYYQNESDTTKGVNFRDNYSGGVYYNMGMVKTDNPISANTTNELASIKKLFSKSNGLIVYSVANKNANPQYDLKYDLVQPTEGGTNKGIALTEEYFYNIKQGDIDYTDDESATKSNIVFSRFELPASILKEVSKLANENKNMVYMSSLLKMADYESGEIKVYPTAYDMLTKIKAHGGFYSHNFGVMPNDGALNSVSVLGSVINYYDNILRLGNLATNQVRVDHVYRNTDGTQKRIEGNWESVGDSKTVNKDNKKIPEVGKNQYIGYKTVSGNTKSGAIDILETNSSEKGKGYDVDSKVTIASNQEDEYTIVTYYYDYRQLDIGYYSGKQPLKTESIMTTIKENPAKNFGKFSYQLNAINPYYILVNGKKYNLSAKTLSYNKNWTDAVDLKKEGAWKRYFTLGENPFVISLKELNGSKNLKFGDYAYVKLNMEYEAPKKVYVRHFSYDASTGTNTKCVATSFLANTDEVVWDSLSGKWKIAPNGYNQRKYASGDEEIVDSITNGFHESYTIDRKDKMKIEKSRTLIKEGTIYDYKGYVISAKTASKTLDSNSAKGLRGSGTTTLSLEPSKEDIYIDFYYETKDHTIDNDCQGNDCSSDKEPDAPTLEFDAQDVSGKSISNNTGDSANCKTVYVPAGEKLKPYMSAISSRAYTVIYRATQVNESTGKLVYHLKQYDAYQYNGGAVQNDTNTTGNQATNPIASNMISKGKEGVFNQDANTNVAFSVTSEAFLKQMKEERNKLNNVGTPSDANILNDGRLTNVTDFPDAAKDITKDKYNGLRVPAGVANYNIVSLVKDGEDVEPSKVNEMTVKSNSKTTVNVLTPLKIENIKIESANVVDHSQLNRKDVFVIQKNAEFKITTTFGNADQIYKNLSTTKYATHVWVKLDFDIKTITNTTIYQNGGTKQIAAGQMIKASDNVFLLIENRNGIFEFSAIATSGSNDGDVISSLRNNIKIVGVTYNVPNDAGNAAEYAMLNNATAVSTNDKYMDAGAIKAKQFTCGSNQQFDPNSKTHKDLSVNNDVFKSMYYAANYMAYTNKKSTNLSRIYDFKITDCLDVNFKNVFRITKDQATVNELTGVKYFSGLKRLIIYSGDANYMQPISDAHLNDIPSKTILPLGPQKHTAKNYLQAPKMGYRISFDLKTSGVYQKGSNDLTRYIKITPSYYYIPKNKQVTTQNDINDNIALYYKNSAGKYVNFAGSDYTIYFKPKDGYRSTYNKDVTGSDSMSDKLEMLKIGGTSFKLTDNMMETSDNNFIQSWYGEFKLPNSTIAIPVGGDLNHPLTDGYIGVKFKIECVTMEKRNGVTEDSTDGSCVIIGYGTNNKNAQNNELDNTSQWDYESYLGFNNPGKTVINELKLPLENGALTITDNTLYNKVKGTVALFDLDNRAANDFE